MRWGAAVIEYHECHASHYAPPLSSAQHILLTSPAAFTQCAPQASQLYEALAAARAKYYLEPRREARGWKVTPVLAAEQQVRAPCCATPQAFSVISSCS